MCQTAILLFSKIAALEKELEEKHQEHLKKVVQDTENKWDEKYQELSSESEKLKSEILTLNEKVIQLVDFVHFSHFLNEID